MVGNCLDDCRVELIGPLLQFAVVMPASGHHKRTSQCQPGMDWAPESCRITW